ncbi:MAG: hypothetical protein RL028_454 [Actinomycetota bacterium]
MKRMSRLLAILLVVGLAVAPGVSANERMKSSSEAPDPSHYNLVDFTFTGTGVFAGRWERFRIATPKSVKCTEYVVGRTNCYAWIRLSSETWVTVDPAGKYVSDSSFLLETSGGVGTNTAVVWSSNALGQSLGTKWTETQIGFTMKDNGTVYMRPTHTYYSFTYTPAPIIVTVKSQAEADAERAAKEAADKAAADKAAAAEAARIAKILGTKLTISCKSGSKTKKVTGDPAVCPKGYSNPIGGEPAFQAYSKCRLYKKTWGLARAALQDSGKTLNIDGYGLGYSEIEFNASDWACVVSALKMPSSVLNKIGQTRALDGMVSAKFGKVSAFWTYHPDDGLDITFSR